MLIGFGNGNFYKLYAYENQRFEPTFMNHFKAGGANAIELQCIDESAIDYVINTANLQLNGFEFVSIHAPSMPYADDDISAEILSKLEILTEKFKIKNIVFHPDTVRDWEFLAKYKSLPISIENMDNDKNFGRRVEDIQSILERYPFGFTLDLQHTFTNDPSMKLAEDFQKALGNRLVEYHLSGFDQIEHHYALFKTGQKEIINSLVYKDIPIIIESTFEQLGDQEKEIGFIKNVIF